MAAYSFFFNLTFIFYVLSAVSYIIFFITQKDKTGLFGFYFSLIGFSCHSLALVIRAVNLKHLPVTGLYESLSFFAWTIMLVYVLIQRKQRNFIHGAFILPLIILLMALALPLDNQIRPLLPALKSYWLGIHSALCFLSYACFSLSFVFGVMYLLQEREVKYKKINGFFFRLPSLGLLDRLGYHTIIFGFLFLSLGIISGSIWAQAAWGAFWSWDAKEVWSLIMWLVYVVYLHGRLMRGWQGRKSAYLAIIGFLIMLFTYLGVSFILPGLHTYL